MVFPLSGMMRIIATFLLATGLAQTIEHPKLSPTGKLKAYYTLCSEQSGGCPPSVVVQDASGRVLREFHVITRGADGHPCMSILDIVWVSDNSIGAECHLTPSASEYVETDITTGKALRDLNGLLFTPSPDGKHVAHIGPIPHFAPPYAQSYYVQVDGVTIYPLTRGARPSRTRDQSPPDVVEPKGDTWVGIHDIESLMWSSDSNSVEFNDCTYDWTPAFPSDNRGKQANRRCQHLRVALNGNVTRESIVEMLSTKP
jgi:hypothetical protein